MEFIVVADSRWNPRDGLSLIRRLYRAAFANNHQVHAFIVRTSDTTSLR